MMCQNCQKYKTEIEKYEKEIEEYKKEIEEYKTKIKELDLVCETYEKDNDEFVKRIQELEEQIKKISNEKDLYERKKEYYELHTLGIQENDVTKNDLNSQKSFGLDELLVQEANFDCFVEAITPQYSDLLKACEKLKAKNEEYENNISILEDAIQEYNDQLSSMLSKNELLRNELYFKKRQIECIRESRDKYEQENERLLKEKKELKKKLKNYESPEQAKESKRKSELKKFYTKMVNKIKKTKLEKNKVRPLSRKNASLIYPKEPTNNINSCVWAIIKQ